MSRDEAEAYLTSGVYKSISIPGHGDVIMEPEDCIEFIHNPIAWVSAQMGCTEAELLCYLEDDKQGRTWSYQQCEAITRKGKQCKNWDMDTYLLGFEGWLELHRSGKRYLCTVHRRMEDLVEQ